MHNPDSDDPLYDGSFDRKEAEAEIREKLSVILKDMFPKSRERQRIKSSGGRLNFCAPCCGDSTRDERKKRGNITLTGKYANTYKCYNCGMFMSATKFLSTYGDGLSVGCIDYLNGISVEADRNSVAEASISILYDMDKIERNAIGRDDLKRKLGLEECTSGEACAYLVKRRQFSFDRFLFNRQHGLLFLLNLTPGGRIFGMQVSDLKRVPGKPKYRTYNITRIRRDMMKLDCDEITDDMDTLSMIFNIFLVDYNKVVTIVEGPMDSFLVKNSIALCGAGKNAGFFFRYRYMFDSDKSGKEHTIEKLSEGCEVFMWDKYISDVGLPRKSKWDYNDAVKWAHENSVTLPKIDGYFSNNEMDAIYI